MRVSRPRFLVPALVVAGMLIPAAPAAFAANTAFAASTPTTEKITGTLQTIIREQPPGQETDAGADDTERVLRVGTKLVPLTDSSLASTEDGTKVSVTVAPAADGEKLVLSATTISGPVAAAIPAAHQVYVALVRPAGITADPTLTDAAARAMVARVSAYWSSQTGAKVSFVTADLRSYQSALTCADTYGMWEEALARMPAASGPGKHLVVVAPGGASNQGCAYGLGTIGAVEASGNRVFVSGLNQSLLAHELGHNLGLYHSNALRCGSAQDMPKVGISFPGCQEEGYDDLFDVMGYSGLNYGEGNLNAVHLDGMNLLPGAVRRIETSPSVTTARIVPLSVPLSATTVDRTLKVTDTNGANYFVEYRTNSGRDTVASLNSWRPAWGVRVLRDDPDAPPSAGSYELDATPTSLTNDYNRVIPVGGTFTAASRNLSIAVTAADADGATLSITYGAVPIPPAPAVPARATMSIPSRAMVGAAITAATVVTDQYGRAKPGWTVTLQKMQRGTTTWRSLVSLRTSASGAASYRFINGVSGSYRWVTAAATGTVNKFSPTVAVTSIARSIERRPALSMMRGTYLSVYGSVSSVPSPIVYIQYRHAGGTWRTGPRATVIGTAVSGRIAMNIRTTAYTRLYVRSATAYAGSISGFHATSVR